METQLLSIASPEGTPYIPSTLIDFVKQVGASSEIVVKTAKLMPRTKTRRELFEVAKLKVSTVNHDLLQYLTEEELELVAKSIKVMTTNGGEGIAQHPIDILLAPDPDEPKYVGDYANYFKRKFSGVDIPTDEFREKQWIDGLSIAITALAELVDLMKLNLRGIVALSRIDPARPILIILYVSYIENRPEYRNHPSHPFYMHANLCTDTEEKILAFILGAMLANTKRGRLPKPTATSGGRVYIKDGEGYVFEKLTQLFSCISLENVDHVKKYEIRWGPETRPYVVKSRGFLPRRDWVPWTAWYASLATSVEISPIIANTASVEISRRRDLLVQLWHMCIKSYGPFAKVMSVNRARARDYSQKTRYIYLPPELGSKLIEVLRDRESVRRVIEKYLNYAIEGFLARPRILRESAFFDFVNERIVFEIFEKKRRELKRGLKEVSASPYLSVLDKPPGLNSKFRGTAIVLTPPGRLPQDGKIFFHRAVYYHIKKKVVKGRRWRKELSAKIRQMLDELWVRGGIKKIDTRTYELDTYWLYTAFDLSLPMTYTHPVEKVMSSLRFAWACGMIAPPFIMEEIARSKDMRRLPTRIPLPPLEEVFKAMAEEIAKDLLPEAIELLDKNGNTVAIEDRDKILEELRDVLYEKIRRFSKLRKRIVGTIRLGKMVFKKISRNTWVFDSDWHSVYTDALNIPALVFDKDGRLEIRVMEPSTWYHVWKPIVDDLLMKRSEYIEFLKKMIADVATQRAGIGIELPVKYVSGEELVDAMNWIWTVDLDRLNKDDRRWLATLRRWWLKNKLQKLLEDVAKRVESTIFSTSYLLPEKEVSLIVSEAKKEIEEMRKNIDELVRNIDVFRYDPDKIVKILERRLLKKYLRPVLERTFRKIAELICTTPSVRWYYPDIDKVIPLANCPTYTVLKEALELLRRDPIEAYRRYDDILHTMMHKTMGAIEIRRRLISNGFPMPSLTDPVFDPFSSDWIRVCRDIYRKIMGRDVGESECIEAPPWEILTIGEVLKGVGSKYRKVFGIDLARVDGRVKYKYLIRLLEDIADYIGKYCSTCREGRYSLTALITATVLTIRRDVVNEAIRDAKAEKKSVGLEVFLRLGRVYSSRLLKSVGVKPYIIEEVIKSLGTQAVYEVKDVDAVIRALIQHDLDTAMRMDTLARLRELDKILEKIRREVNEIRPRVEHMIENLMFTKIIRKRVRRIDSVGNDRVENIIEIELIPMFRRFRVEIDESVAKSYCSRWCRSGEPLFLPEKVFLKFYSQDDPLNKYTRGFNGFVDLLTRSIALAKTVQKDFVLRFPKISAVLRGVDVEDVEDGILEELDVLVQDFTLEQWLREMLKEEFARYGIDIDSLTSIDELRTQLVEKAGNRAEARWLARFITKHRYEIDGAIKWIHGRKTFRDIVRKAIAQHSDVWRNLCICRDS